MILSKSRNIPDGWRWTTMGEFLSIARNYIIIDDDKEYQLLTVKLHGKGIVRRSALKGSQIKTKEQQIAHKNQFLVAEIDAKFGAFGVVSEEFDGAIVSGHYFLYNIDTTKVIPAFLECFVSSGILTQQIQKNIQGALNYSAIRPQHILEVPFPLPQRDSEKQQLDVILKREAIKRIQFHAERQLDASIALEKSLMRQAFDFKLSRDYGKD